MSASVGVAIAAVVIAAASLLHSIWQVRRTAAALREERADRREELELLRRQVEAQADETQQRKRARIDVTLGGIFHGHANDEYGYKLTNTGRAPARNVLAALHDEDGEQLGDRVSTRAPLLAGQSEDVTFSIPHGVFWRTPPKPRCLIVSWEDDDGPHSRRTWIDLGRRGLFTSRQSGSSD